MTEPLFPGAARGTPGIYVHVPFCLGGKCPYCDFYSLPYEESAAERYLRAAARVLREFGARAGAGEADTVYFGGGTPTALGPGLARLLETVRKAFRLAEGAEITFEANPGPELPALLPALAGAGFNRMSLGLQSAVPKELRALGRRHSFEDVARAVRAARQAGIAGISLDLMLCVPGQTRQSLRESIERAAELGPGHISAYLLKVEEGTPFFARKESLCLPDEEEQADRYLEACQRLEENGFVQYEISNFARPGREARHNLKYWRCEEYLGVGPGAHSFWGGRRFHYERSLSGFLEGRPAVDDGEGGSFEEFCMLGLRLTEGLRETGLRRRFGRGFEAFDAAALQRLEDGGFLKRQGEILRLTRRGFLVSNSVISSLLF